MEERVPRAPSNLGSFIVEPATKNGHSGVAGELAQPDHDGVPNLPDRIEHGRIEERSVV